MRSTLSRRRFLQATVSAIALASVGTDTLLTASPANAASVPAMGTIAIKRLWGTKKVRRAIPGSRRTRLVSVPKTKSMYSGIEPRIINTGGLCHWPNTAEPFDPGHCVLFGHRTSAGGPLKYSHRLRVGDPIVVTVGDQSLTYYVTQAPFVVGKDDVLPTLMWDGGGKARITLVTCTKANKQPTSTKYRLLIRAEAR